SLQFGEGNAGMLLGIPLIIATLISIPAIFLINKNRSPIVAFFSIAVTIIGALYIFFVVGDGSGLDPNRVVAGYSDVFNIKNLPILIGITLLGIGYVCSIQTYMVWQKKLYPDEQRGQFEGIRILFFVLFPMVLGSLIAQPIIEATGASRDIIGINGMVYTESLPTHYLFIGSAVLALLSIIPLIFATRLHNERVKLEKTAEVIVAPID
ncbi:MAG: MFS transporter, partial [Clostridia bacterium]|nr:MFS transporter [Clostridia bacterium]